MIFLLHQCSQLHNKIYIEYILFIQDIKKTVSDVTVAKKIEFPTISFIGCYLYPDPCL